MPNRILFNYMVEYNVKLDDIFRSLADPTRRDILRRLSPGEQTVGELAGHYDLTFAAVSKHLQVLERAKLVRKRKRGREQRARLSPGGLKQADKYLEQYRRMWEGKLGRLETFLTNNK
jgi:DNA-binding transcriptional ArsR family regulator